LQVALILGGVSLAVGAPSTFLSIMASHWSDVYQQLLPGWKSTLSKLKSVLTTQGEDFISVNNPREKRLSNVISGQLQAWYKHYKTTYTHYHRGISYTVDVEGTCEEFKVEHHSVEHYNYYGMTNSKWHELNLIRAHKYAPPHNEVFEAMCTAAKHQDHFINVCNRVAKSACDKMHDYTSSNEEYRHLTEKAQSIAAQYADTNKNIHELDQCINGDDYCQEVTGTWMPSIISFAALGGCVVSVFMFYYLWHTSNDYKDKMKHIKDVNEMPLEPIDAIKLLWVAERVGVDVTNLSIDNFKQILDEQYKAIQERWERRVAFLSAKYDPNSTANFFMRNADKNIKKMILQYAELAPQHAMKL
jgi:hypothetical protein